MFVALQVMLVQLSIVLIIFLSPKDVALAATFLKAKPNCIDHCGNISIPFPFGMTPDCYHHSSFFITCNQTFSPPKAFLQNSSIEITAISLKGQLRAWQFIAHDCYDRNGKNISKNDPWIKLPKYLTVNHTANRFTVVGCDTYAFVSGYRLNRDYQTGCTAMCDTKDDVVEGSCTGLGCCHTSIPKDVWNTNFSVKSYYNHSYVWDFNPCGYAFLVEKSRFRFSTANLSSLRSVKKVPMLIDWAIGNETCEEAAKNSTSYACKSTNSMCYKPRNGYGYRCSCLNGYEGNPYLANGCQDTNECENQNACQKNCVNTPGGYYCTCPEGYHGDGRKNGRGCIRDQSLVIKLVAGISLGITVLLLAMCLLFLELKRRKLIKIRKKFFHQNGGLLLQEKLLKRERSSDATKVFTSDELKKATNNFQDSWIIGRGGYGTVYRGFLPDNRAVAIKKSKVVDSNQVEQFINEVIILTQINHRNVVKLLGCCLEAEVPLLVYEFIDNGTLFDHIHERNKARSLCWDARVRIAAETAGVLSYLHSAASTPVIHRDVKSTNVLLDSNLTAKVSDFGASRLVPLDHTRLATVVQGTLGYLDPEYFLTSQLTEKSDVYSFGVVLVELFTGQKAVSYERPQEDRNLANYFLSMLKQDCLFHILDANVGREGNNEALLVEFAALAKRCLNVKGDDRPSMKEVAMGLEGLRLNGKHTWVQNEHNLEETHPLLEMQPVNESANNDGSVYSTNVGHDSIKGHFTLPSDGGR